MNKAQKFGSADFGILLLILSLLGALVLGPFLVARDFGILGALITALVAVLAWIYIGPRPSLRYAYGITGLCGFAVLIGAVIVWLVRAIHHEGMKVPDFPKWFIPGLIVAVGAELLLVLVARKFSRILACSLGLLAFFQCWAGWYIIHAPRYIAGADLGGANFGPLFAFFFLFWGSIAGWLCCLVAALFLALGRVKTQHGENHSLAGQ